jgi:predicted esterase
MALPAQVEAQEAPAVEGPTPHQRLHEAVSLPTAKARAKAAKALAKDRDISLKEWLSIMQGFGIFPEVEPGLQTVHVSLRIDGKEEETELVLYVPSVYHAEKAWPLLLLLHGAGGDGMGMVRNWQAFAEKHGYLLLAPTDPESGKGYAFRERERQAGLGALRWMRLQHHIDENRIHVHGVSRGGHMAWDLGTRFPDLFASMVPAIGGPTWTLAKGRNNLRMVENLHRMPIRDLQGAQDDAHLLRNLRQAFARLKAVGNDQAILFEFPDLGHSFRTDVVPWPDFFDACMRDPWPTKVLYRQARKDQPRAAWVRIDRFDKTVDEHFRIEAPPKWASMTDFERAAYIQGLADERTAKLQATRQSDGTFRVSSEGASRLMLYLPLDWIPEDGTISAQINGDTRKLKVKPSKTTLLLDFVERFDRTVLPVAEVSIKI